jgi:hypothetical protein
MGLGLPLLDLGFVTQASKHLSQAVANCLKLEF